MPFIANRGEGWTEQNPPQPNSVVVSITGSDRKAILPDGYVDVLRLRFQDYDPIRYEQDGVNIKNIPDDAILFDRSHAARISRFARKHRGKNIVIHCAAGISRSGAIAEALLQAFPEYEDQGWQRHPNTHVLILMKRALGLVPLGAEDGS
jgi:predicted protein tyrosine phosphatase